MTPGAVAEPPSQSTRLQRRGLLSRGPIWMRVSMFTALVLVGVFLSTMVVAAIGIGDGSNGGGGHGSGQRMEMRPGGDHGARGDHESGEGGTETDHGSSDDPSTRDHDSGD